MEGMLAGLMFLVAFLLIFLGFPVSFSLGGTALIFAFIGVELELFSWAFMGLFPQRVFGIMSNYVLLAVPFFILMGTILEKSKLAEELLTTIGVLFGRVRGGLALALLRVLYYYSGPSGWGCRPGMILFCGNLRKVYPRRVHCL